MKDVNMARKALLYGIGHGKKLFHVFQRLQTFILLLQSKQKVFVESNTVYCPSVVYFMRYMHMQGPLPSQLTR